nr:ribose-phosphate pyrophosphokinase-like domain-containing protein [Cupriavidus taiwanensis]
MAGQLAAALRAEPSLAVVRRFPDGESYVRIDSTIQDRRVVIVCTLDRPDDKLCLAALAIRGCPRERRG